MRLYSLTEDVPAIDHPDFGHFEPDDSGGFDLPDQMVSLLHSSAVAGVKQWETGPERQLRTAAAELRRKQSPDALYDLFERFVQAAGAGLAARDAGHAEKEPAADKEPAGDGESGAHPSGPAAPARRQTRTAKS
jgi:hypothetical protein